MDMGQRGATEGDYASAISLYHAYDLLLQHGMRTFYNFVSKVTGEGEQVTRRALNEQIWKFETLKVWKFESCSGQIVELQ